MRYKTDIGEVWMRPDDHQLQQEMPPFLGYISEEQGDMTKVPGDTLSV